MPSIEPGWYPDPGDSSKLRYWDGSGWTDHAAPAGGRGRALWPWLLVGLAAVLAAGAVTVALLVSDGSKDKKAEVILEPADSGGDDPFTESVANITVSVNNGGVKEVKGGGKPVESISGAEPGLYGGTGDQAVCDPKALVSFLKKNPDKAAAFAEVFGIAPGEIDDYVAKLTPVLLREDTRVTNHGFRDGHATTLQSVLQAGTAVMVDDRGVPRIRCACGNPLTEPAAVTAAPDYQGDRWDDFDERRLIAISKAPRPVDRLKVVNVRNGEPYVTATGRGATDVRELVFDFGGVGPLRIGMTEKEAEAATGLDARFTSPLEGCWGVSFRGFTPLSGLAFEQRTIQYLSVYAGPGARPGGRGARSVEGVRIGDTKDDVEKAYPGMVKSMEPAYPQGGLSEWLVVEDGNGGALLFSTGKNGQIESIITGTPDSVLTPEGCA